MKLTKKKDIFVFLGDFILNNIFLLIGVSELNLLISNLYLETQTKFGINFFATIIVLSFLISVYQKIAHKPYFNTSKSSSFSSQINGALIYVCIKIAILLWFTFIIFLTLFFIVWVTISLIDWIFTVSLGDSIFGIGNVGILCISFGLSFYFKLLDEIEEVTPISFSGLAGLSLGYFIAIIGGVGFAIIMLLIAGGILNSILWLLEKIWYMILFGFFEIKDSISSFTSNKYNVIIFLLIILIAVVINNSKEKKD